MDALGGNPADALGKVCDELKSKFDEAGMGAVDVFMDGLEEMQEMVKKGPTTLIDSLKEVFETFKKKMQEFIDNPGSLAPGAGMMAQCASWYGSTVAGKMAGLKDEAQELLERLQAVGGQIKDPMNKLGDTLGKTIASLEGTVKKMAKLPQQLSTLKDGVKGTEDVGNIDTAPMKKCLDASGISGPLDALAGLKEPLKEGIDAANTAVQTLIDFLETVPGRVKACFDVPTPLCFLQSAIMSQAPEAMTQLLEMVDNVKKLDMTPLKEGLGKIETHVCNLDTNAVQEPVKKFAESAKDSIANLDKVVQGAKMATGGGLAAAAKGIPGVGKMF